MSFPGAYRVACGDREIPVAEDEALLRWARANGFSPRQAQLRALDEGVMPLRYLKNLWALSFEEQRRLCAASVFVCGCGGLGGGLAHLLARAGVGRLRLVDPDVFSPSNLNRQWLSTVEGLGESKATEAARLLRSVNPLTETEPVGEKLEEGRLDDLLEGMDLVLDGLDNLEARFVLARGAARAGLPFVHAAVAGWWGQIRTFLPGGPSGLESVYGRRRSRDSAEDASGALGPAVSAISSLQALEAARILTGRPPAYAERLFYFDGETGAGEFLPS